MVDGPVVAIVVFWVDFVWLYSTIEDIISFYNLSTYKNGIHHEQHSKTFYFE